MLHCLRTPPDIWTSYGMHEEKELLQKFLAPERLSNLYLSPSVMSSKATHTCSVLKMGYQCHIIAKHNCLPASSTEETVSAMYHSTADALNDTCAVH